MNGLSALTAYKDPNARFDPGVTAAPATVPKANGLAAPTAPNPLTAMRPKQENGLLATTLNAFQKSLDPKGHQARLDQNKADDKEAKAKEIATLQGIRKMPMEQRLALLPQISQAMGGNVPESAMSDAELDAALALRMGEAGMVQEPLTAYQQAQLDAEAAKAGQPTFYNRDKGVYAITPDGQASIVAGTEDEAERPDLPEGMWYGPDGKGEPQAIPGYVNMRTQIARGSQSPGVQGNYRALSPEEVAQRGYPKGTVVQVDSRGQEHVKSRPSTAQTGQPTESERSAGLHATVALNGMQKLTQMERSGYNRAGMGEQIGGVFGQQNERLYDQAANEFIDGYLRAMTGAAATKQEIDTYKKQWFAEFGDTPVVLQQKAQGRLNALRGMKSKAGRSWKPEWDQAIADLESQLGVDQYDAAIEDAIAIGDRSRRELDARDAIDPELERVLDEALGPDEDDLPEGVTQEEWDNMDEQDKALFR